jgi:glycosyltransferase involved in cell wall biosynthesis
VAAVHQIVATLRYGDAIGNQALGIARVLRAAGYDSEILVEHADARSRDLAVDYRDMVDEVGADDILIDHFSLGSRASRTAFALPCRLILNYHNITPPEYFIGVHDLLVRECFKGRREIAAYRTRVDLALGASEFNRQELAAMGFAPTAVLPVVPSFAHLAGPPDPRVLAAYDDEATNVLFVGRITPNKRQDGLIRHFHAYQTHFNPRARLLLAGTAEGFEGYLIQLRVLAADLGVRDVEFLGQVTNEQLTALYDVADLFLSASEHEGFCVPLVEAFHKHVPVIALARAAVPATMDGGGILYDTTDPIEVAALMDAVLSDDGLEDRVLDAQAAALARLLARDFDGALLGFVAQVAAAPRRPLPPVAADFWDDFRVANELDDIRRERPLAFHRLPPPPESRGLGVRAGGRA